MKRISVMREVSGRSGRRRGSQKPGMATGPAGAACGGAGRQAAPCASRRRCRADIPSAAPVIRSADNRLFARRFIFMIDWLSGVTGMRRGLAYRRKVWTDQRHFPVLGLEWRTGVGAARSIDRARQDDWNAPAAIPSLVPSIGPSDLHSAPSVRYRSLSRCPEIDCVRHLLPPSLVACGRVARRRRPASAPTAC